MYHHPSMSQPSMQQHFLYEPGTTYAQEEDDPEDWFTPVPERFLKNWPESGSSLYCNKQMLLGPDDWYNGLPRTVVMTSVPLVLLLAWSFEMCWPKGHLILFFFIWIMTPIMYWTLFLTSSMDPGFIPPQNDLDPEEGNPVVWKYGRLYRHMVLEEKWDKNAKLYRPLRAKYDTMSEFNVERFDHWCNWVSNAIGVRNHKMFMLFLYSINSLLIACGILALVGLENFENLEAFFLSFSNLLHPNGFVLLALLLYSPAFLVFTIWLLWKQTYYICSNLTTSEALKPFHRKGRPFNRGCCNNCMEFWFKHDFLIPSHIFHPIRRREYDMVHPPDQVDTWIGREGEGEGRSPGHGEDFHIVGRVLEEEQYGEDKKTSLEQRTFEGYLQEIQSLGTNRAIGCQCCLDELRKAPSEIEMTKKIKKKKGKVPMDSNKDYSAYNNTAPTSYDAYQAQYP
eukprot:Platyproteum_vivax@DN4985_c0_g1_i1.p1